MRRKKKRNWKCRFLLALLLPVLLAAAVIQPISDRRISGCISGMGEGARLFGKTMATAMVMLLLTIALVVSSTT